MELFFLTCDTLYNIVCRSCSSVSLFLFGWGVDPSLMPNAIEEA
jgi:hypothetical protein